MRKKCVHLTTKVTYVHSFQRSGRWHPCRQHDMERAAITMVRQAAAELQGNHRPQRKCSLSVAFAVLCASSD